MKENITTNLADLFKDFDRNMSACNGQYGPISPLAEEQRAKLSPLVQKYCNGVPKMLSCTQRRFNRLAKKFGKRRAKQIISASFKRRPEKILCRAKELGKMRQQLNAPLEPLPPSRRVRARA